MTRTYAFSLIAVILLSATGLLYLQREWLQQEQTVFLELAEKVQDEAILQKIEQLDILGYQIEKRLADDSKAKFRPVEHLFAIAEKSRGIYFKQVKVSNHTASQESFFLFHQDEMNKLKEAAVTLLSARHWDFDLNQSDYLHRVEAYEADYKKNTSLYKPTRTEKALYRKLLTMQFLSFQESLLLSFSQITGGRALIFDHYFPILMDNTGVVRKGEKRATKIAIGSYSSALNPDNVQLRANGEELKLGIDGTAVYFLPSNLRGNHVVDMEVAIINRLTGQITQGEGQYHYEVR